MGWLLIRIYHTQSENFSKVLTPLKDRRIMCLNPVSFRNPVKDTLGGLEFISLPCRHCSECAEVLSNDYVVRTLALINSNPDYCWFFTTLTFNELFVPWTNVYKNIDGLWKVIDRVRCFNHALYRRFRKNFSEYFKDKYGKKIYILTTCEFGKKNTKRPHYHCIIGVPCLLSWKGFMEIIGRFWHYGFTKNISIAQIDGIKHNRSVLNCVKYVTKYACKYNSDLPYYLKDKDTFVTDYPPCDVCIRTFVSKGYGDSLCSILKPHNYINDSVVINFDKQYKEFSIPAYYKRKYFTRTEQYIIDSYFPDKKGFPYDDKLVKRKKFIKKSVSYRINNYDVVLYKNFRSRLSTLITNYQYDLSHDLHFRRLLANIDSNTDFEYVDWGLSPTLFDDMCKYYLSAKRPCSLSPLSLSPQREQVTKRFYLKSWTDTISEFALRFKITQEYARNHGLPWLPLPSIAFRSSRPTDYTMPVDYMKLQFYQHYKRNCRLQHAINKNHAELDFLRNHVIPYSHILD